jgi:hypothetical protein
VLSHALQWIDIDSEQWGHVWDLLYGPARQPVRLYGLLDHGAPAALVHTRLGPLARAIWPDGAPSLPKTAAVLRERAGVEQVILVERRALAALWDRQQRAYRPDLDYEQYTVQLGAMTADLLREQAVCDPPMSALTAYPPIRYEALFDLLRCALGDEGHFLLAAFAGNEIWFSLAGSVAHGKVVTLTSTLGLFPPGVCWSDDDWKWGYRLLLSACAERLGPPSLGIFLDVETFKRLPFAAEPALLLREAAEKGSAVLDPWPAGLSATG